ncbi:peptide deformylase [Agrobacterium sp. CNPSo 3708]|uniref:peptide deformylase n=1 Tax=Agrobacterium sp. CNPSo 3708 TaxID=3028150 RepID=UPI00236362FC|nr:peptide deformylase [Agrobacterium sp. CNPSo 3708]MDD1498982.1 peptide deformylase [Agrobacterium sp. CNPSo 3708]
MSVRKIEVADEAAILGSNDSILRTRCLHVGAIDEYVKTVIQDLKDTLRSDTLSVGLAAPQIGYNLSIAVINLDKMNNSEDIVLINPVVKSESGQLDVKYESCMSIPHKKGKVKRRKKIALIYMDVDGKERELISSGFEARVILHEIDHLNGVLFVDRMEEGATLEDTDLFRTHGI